MTTATSFFEFVAAEDHALFKFRRAADRSRTCRGRHERYIRALQEAVSGAGAPCSAVPHGAARSAARSRLSSGVIEGRDRIWSPTDVSRVYALCFATLLCFYDSHENQNPSN